jgi:hypothetical protein
MTHESSRCVRDFQGEGGSISRIADFFLIKGTKHAILFKGHRGSSEKAVLFLQGFVDFLRCLSIQNPQKRSSPFSSPVSKARSKTNPAVDIEVSLINGTE